MYGPEKKKSSSGENGSSRPIRNKKIPKRFQDHGVITSLSVLDLSIPHTYEEAINSSKSTLWKADTNDEINAMHVNGIWQLRDKNESNLWITQRVVGYIL